MMKDNKYFDGLLCGIGGALGGGVLGPLIFEYFGNQADMMPGLIGGFIGGFFGGAFGGKFSKKK